MILCKICGEKAAEVKVIGNENGKKTEKPLCRACNLLYDRTQREQKEENAVNESNDALTGFAVRAESHDFKNHACPTCGRTAAEISASSFVGCAACYDEFYSILLPYIEKVQGNLFHKGKTPDARHYLSDQTESQQLANERQKLQEALSLAIKENRFKDCELLKQKLEALGE